MLFSQDLFYLAFIRNSQNVIIKASKLLILTVTYVRRYFPFVRMYWQYLQRDNIEASLHPQHQHKQDLLKKKFFGQLFRSNYQEKGFTMKS